MGIDLLKESRPYIYFSADDKIGCISKEYYYIYRTNGIKSLHKYLHKDPRNYIDSEKNLFNDMQNYTFSMLQTTQWLVKNNLTGK